MACPATSKKHVSWGGNRSSGAISSNTNVRSSLVESWPMFHRWAIPRTRLNQLIVPPPPCERFLANSSTSTDVGGQRDLCRRAGRCTPGTTVLIDERLMERHGLRRLGNDILGM